MAGISVASKTSDSVTLYISNLDETWANGERTVYWYLGYGNSGMPSANAYYKTDTASLEDEDPSGGHVTFSGLKANTEYGICCEIYHGSEFLKELTGWVRTNEESLVRKWNWYESNGSATVLQTVNAFDALNNQEPTTNFSYKVWNDMVDKVWEILAVSEGEWDDRYAPYEATRMKPSDRTLTATRFNSLRYNLGYMPSAAVKPGDPVRGTYFIEITNTMNKWIDTL